MNWHLQTSLPPGHGVWEYWRPPFGKPTRGEARVRRALWQWHPWDPILIGTPDSDHLMPPVCVPGLGVQVHRRMLFQYRLLLGLIALLTLGSVIAFFSTDSKVFRSAAFGGCVLLGFVYIQYRLVFSSIENVRDLAKFVASVYLDRRHAVPVAIVVMLVIGVTQWLIQGSVGGFEPLIVRYGLFFDVANEQWWRYLTGPLFHSGAAHWIANGMFLVVAVGLSSSVGKRYVLAAIFVSGVIVSSVVLSTLPESVRGEAFVGVSGGVFSLFGWISGVAIRNRDQFPRHFGLTMTLFCVVLVSTSALLNPRDSTTAHAAGLIFGLSLGLMSIGLRER